MTVKHQFIAGDWGTSNLRLYLCEYQAGSATIIDTKFGSGISQISGDFEGHFFSIAQEWLDATPDMPVLLSGMVGSTIGWKEAPYLTCPVNRKQIAEGQTNFVARGVTFSILAGLKTINPLSAPDVMRGEELQLLGWMRSQHKTSGKQLFVLPGTHNKWALCEDGKIHNFLTAFTGEMFALLRNHSILITEKNTFNFNETIFQQGLEATPNLGEAHLLHTLFATRSKQVLGEMSHEDSLSYLSGLIIGADVAGALTMFDNYDTITIIGDPTLSQHYQLALKHFGFESNSCDPTTIAVAGFEAIYEEIIQF